MSGFHDRSCSPRYAGLKPGADNRASTKGAPENAYECILSMPSELLFGPLSGPLLSARGLNPGHEWHHGWSRMHLSDALISMKLVPVSPLIAAVVLPPTPANR